MSKIKAVRMAHKFDGFESGVRAVASPIGALNKAIGGANDALRRLLPELPTGSAFSGVSDATRGQWIGLPAPTRQVAGPSAETREYFPGVFLPVEYIPGVLPPTLGNKAWATVQLPESLWVVQAYQRTSFVHNLMWVGIPGDVAEQALEWMTRNEAQRNRMRLRDDEDGTVLLLDGTLFENHPEYRL